VSAGLRQPSSTRLLADRLVTATVAALSDRGLAGDVAVIELREHAHDVINNLLTGFPSPRLGDVLNEVVQADGLIAVSPIFNATYSGLFKSFFDVIDDEALTDQPVLLGATGGSQRHSLALEHAMRPLFVHLNSVVVPTAVYAATSDWGSRADPAAATDGRDDNQHGLAERITRGGDELATLMAAREPRAARDPLPTPIPFEQLLAQS
jgi:FMN reductase